MCLPGTARRALVLGLTGMDAVTLWSLRSSSQHCSRSAATHGALPQGYNRCSASSLHSARKQNKYWRERDELHQRDAASRPHRTTRMQRCNRNTGARGETNHGNSLGYPRILCQTQQAKDGDGAGIPSFTVPDTGDAFKINSQ